MVVVVAVEMKNFVGASRLLLRLGKIFPFRWCSRIFERFDRMP